MQNNIITIKKTNQENCNRTYIGK